jgi:hypothetical protein
MASHKVYQPVTSAVQQCTLASISATPGDRRYSQECVDRSMSRTKFTDLRISLPPRAGELPSQHLVATGVRSLFHA